MAAGFLEEASGESSVMAGPLGMLRASTGDGDFSPGLKPDVLEPLRRVLGMNNRPRKGKVVSKKVAKSSSKYGPFLH
jgi:hypothetical protein